MWQLPLGRYALQTCQQRMLRFVRRRPGARVQRVPAGLQPEVAVLNPLGTNEDGVRELRAPDGESVSHPCRARRTSGLRATSGGTHSGGTRGGGTHGGGSCGGCLRPLQLFVCCIG